MKYCTIDDIHEKQTDLTFEGSDGTKCRVLVGGAELDICQVMPDNLVLMFKDYCDGCTRFEPDTDILDRDDMGNTVYFTCKHLYACEGLKWRLSDAE